MHAQHQLETLLSGEICNLYRSLTGHSPDLTDCRFLNPGELALVFENTLTTVEQAFLQHGMKSLALEVRRNLDALFHQKLKTLVERYTQQQVVDILSESKIDSGRKIIILILKVSISEDRPETSTEQSYAISSVKE